jgi:hypothetical protein
MDRPALMAIVLAFLALLLLLMYLGWRARQRRQASVPAPREVPAELGKTLFATSLFYVATTVAGEPLNRIAVQGLGFRARASVIVATNGIVLEIPAQRAIFIPVAEIRGVDRATWTIDRVVEQDGLVLLAWLLVTPAVDGRDSEVTSVDTYLRLDSPSAAADLIGAIESILSTISPSTQGGLA